MKFSLKQTIDEIKNKMIGKSVLEVIDGQNLDYDNCVAVSTDGRRFMLSKRCGAVMISKIKNAILCPCSNHTMNLSLTKYAKV